MNKKNGFTLVELLAVIVILAVILVIAVPSIISTITESRKGALASSAKLIASSAESMKISNQALGIDSEITCEDVSNYNTEDYTCDLEFVDGNAEVTLIGKGKFEGMCVSRATKEGADVEEPINGKCPTPFGKDSWETIIAAVRAGNTSKYVVGDTKKVTLTGLGEHTVRIANKSTPTECGQTGFSQTACGFVIEFADIITRHAMNPTNTNVGGWPGSGLYSYLNETIYNSLPTDLKAGIKETKVVSSHGKDDTMGTLANNNFESEDYLYLLSPEEVYGGSFIVYDTSLGTSRQLDWYGSKNVTMVNNDDRKNTIKKNGNNVVHWWLRSARSDDTSHFDFVYHAGACHYEVAGCTTGVSPAFRLG